MNDKARARTLLVEAHALIASESRRAVSRIGVSLRKKVHRFDPAALDSIKPGLATMLAKHISQMTLNYPPENRPLTTAEERALRRFKLTRVERSALRKLVAEACAGTMFHFFCVMDAVGEPHVVPTDRWYGASFTGRREGPMLHDEFGDLYWEYKRATVRVRASKEKKGRTHRGASKRRR